MEPDRLKATHGLSVLAVSTRLQNATRDIVNELSHSGTNHLSVLRLSAKDSEVSTNIHYLGVSNLLLGASLPASAMIGRSYGKSVGSRFRIGMTVTLAAQQVLVGIVLRFSRSRSLKGHEHQLNLVDLMTLSRGWASSLLVGLMVSGVRDRRGAAGWIATLYGAILCDWLDGPVARRRGTSVTCASRLETVCLQETP